MISDLRINSQLVLHQAAYNTRGLGAHKGTHTSNAVMQVKEWLYCTGRLWRACSQVGSQASGRAAPVEASWQSKYRLCSLSCG